MRTRTIRIFLSVFTLLGLLISPISALADSTPRGLSEPHPKAVAPKTVVNAELFASGGPDAFGYTFEDSAEPGGPAYNFEDISGTGTLTDNTNFDDAMSSALPLGFNFWYYGVTYTDVYASTNGFLTFLAGQNPTLFDADPIPNTANPNGVVAGHWADWDPGQSGDMYYQTLGAAPNRRFILQYDNVCDWISCSGFTTFQIKLIEGSNIIEVHYQSNTLNTHIYDNSLGIENQGGTTGLQYQFWPAGSTITLADNSAVRYMPNIADLQLQIETDEIYTAGLNMIADVYVYNNGPDTAFNTTVQLTLPLGFHYLADTDNCTLDSSNPDILLCDLGDLAQWDNPSFQVAIGIDPTLVREDPDNPGQPNPDGTMAFEILGEVFTDSFDPNLDNNVDEADFFVEDLADLHIEKFASPSNEVLAGEQFTYTILVDNYGPSTARNIVIVDTLVTSDLVRSNGCSLAVRTEGGTIDEFDCNFALGTGVFDLATMGSNWLNPRSPTDEGRIRITIDGIAQETLTMTNKATVVSDTPELDSSDNMVEVTLSVTDLADLQLEKIADMDPVVAGQDIVTYTLTVTNNGPSTAENVVVEDKLPAEVDILSVSNTSGSCNAGTPGNPSEPTTCTFGDMLVEAVETMTIEVRFKPDAVKDPVADQVLIWNDAIVYSDILDMNNSNNLAGYNVMVQAQADLGLTMFAVGAPTAGNVMHYEYQIANLGPSVSQDVTLRDFLPDGVVFESAFIDREGGTFADPLACDVTEGSNALFCPLGDIPPTDGVPIFVFVNVMIKSDVPDGTLLTNNADLFLTDTPDPDPTNNSAFAPITVRNVVNLEIHKSAHPQMPVAGTTFYYEITVKNPGPSDAVDLVLTDVLPPDMIYMASDGPCTEAGGVVTCNVGVLPAGESLHIKIYVHLTPFAIGPYTNIVTATVSNDPEPNIISHESTIFVNGEADLHIEKFASPANEVMAGEQFTYTILVDNYGPSNADNIVIVDELITSGFVQLDSCSLTVLTNGPAGIQDVDCSMVTDGVYRLADFGSEYLGPFSTFDRGRVILELNLTAFDALTLTNKATVTADTFDPDTSDNWAVATISVNAAADLQLEKIADLEPVVAGGQVLTYTLTATNTGPSIAENVVIEDNLPAELDIISVSSPDGTCNAGTPGDPSDPTTCTFGALMPDADFATMEVRVRFKPDAVIDPVTDRALFHNDAWVYADTPDLDNSNNLAIVTTTVLARADLSLQKFAVGTPIAGTVMHYEFQIANLGPSVSRDVTLRDFLPDEMAFVSAFIDREGGTNADPLACDVTEGSNALFCPLGDIPPTDGTPIFVFVNVLIKSDVPDGTLLTNNADVLLTDTPDPDTGNNSDDVTIEVTSEVNLDIQKDATPQLPVAGTTFSYDITATNNGPSDAVNLVLTDVLPPGFTFMASDGPCTAAGQDITCFVGTLPAGESISFKIYVHIDPEIIGEFTNVMNATADNVVFNVTSEENTINVIGEADLHIEKFSSPTNEVLAGEDFTYVILVDNYGPSTAYNVVVEDTLITSDFVRANGCSLSILTEGGASGDFDCNYALETGVFKLADFGVEFLNPKSPTDEGRIIITITATADEDLDMTNKTTVVSDTFDPDTSDNFAVDTLSVLASADLYVEKSVDPLEFIAGETATYTIDFGNNGPSTADNVIVVDTLPAGVTLQSITWTFPPGSSGSCLGMETITCTVGTMAPGEVGQIVIVVLVDPALESGSLLQNTVLIYDTETYDPDTSNNTDMVINAVGASADLEITKTAEPVIALKGQTIEYTIVVTNNGPSDVYGAQIFDYFPAELDDVTWECDVYPAWGMCPAAGTGDIEEYFDLKVGRSLTFTVTGVLTTNWPITNEACVVVPPGVVDPYLDNNCDDVTNEPFHSLLPIVFGPAYRVMKPDLVVTCLEVRPFSISLIIKNNGLAPVTEGFWLDIYLDPDYVPTAVNQPWYDVGDQGLVWGITQPLAPGQSLSMTLDSSYFGGRFGYVEWPIEPGTVAFAQVDSYNPYNSDGAVIEDHEVLNGFYNNIFGPVLSVDATDPWTRADVISALEAMDATMLTEPIGLESLPER